MDFGHVQVLRPDASRLISQLGRPLADAGLVRLVVLARTHGRGSDVDRLVGVLPGGVGAGQHDCGRAIADRRAHQAGQRIGDQGCVQDLLGAARCLELGVGVKAAVGVVLGRDLGVVLGGRAVGVHMVAGQLGVEVHEQAA